MEEAKMGKSEKANKMILIFSTVFIIISLNFFTFTVNAVYDTLIMHLAPTATDYFSLSSIIKSISTDKSENIDIANNAYEYLMQKYLIYHLTY